MRRKENLQIIDRKPEILFLRAVNYAQGLWMDFFLERYLINHNGVSKSAQGYITPLKLVG